MPNLLIVFGDIALIRKSPRKLSTTELTAIITDYNAQREIVAQNYNAGNKSLRKIMAVMSFLAFIIIIIVFKSFGGQPGFYAVVVSLIILMFFYSWRSSVDISSAKRLQEQLRKLIFPTIFENVDDFSYDAKTNGFVQQIPESIMPKYNRSEWGDLIQGKFNNQSFAINEINLSYKTSGKASRTVTVFKGVVVRLQRRADKAPTLTVRNNRMALTKWVSNAVGSGIKDQHIKVLDEDIEGQYDVHCRDQNYVKKVFSSDGIKLFKTMIREHAQGQFQFATSDSHIYLLIEQDHDFFELPSINFPLDQVEDIIRLRKEMKGFLNLFKQMDKLLAA